MCTRWPYLTGLVGALSAFYHDSTDINNPSAPGHRFAILFSLVPTLVAMAYKYGKGEPTCTPQRPLLRRQLPAHDVRYAVRGLPGQSGDRTCDGPHLHPARRPRTKRIHLHGAPVRLVGHQPFAAIAAGVACLWGPAHGGANEACLNMLEEIQAMGGVSKVGEFMEKVRTRTLA